MIDREDGGAAFPHIGKAYAGEYLGQVSYKDAPMPGMTLRDYFAGQALEGICSNPDITTKSQKAGLNTEECRLAYSEAAYKTADAMLAARSK